VAKPELGTKRLCGECGAKFYDLNRNPIACPKCGAAFEAVAVTARGRSEPVAAPIARAAAAAAPAEEAAAPETPEAEFVSLEEADAEAQGGAAKTPAAAEGEEEEVELDESIDDTVFIEEQEEGDADVTDIIGEREEDEET
jgi:uncharacterized protein (TIGR02300 family)